MPSTKTVLDARHAQDLLREVFTLLRTYGNGSSSPNAGELQRFFSTQFQLINNDRKVCSNLNDYVKRLQDIQKENSQATYSNLLEEPIVAGNKVVIRYGAELANKSGKRSKYQIIAILTFQDDKITQCTEVIHEVGSSSSTVFAS